MPALPHALAPQSSPLTALAPASGSVESRDAPRNASGDAPTQRFEDAVQQQSEPEQDRPQSDDVMIDAKGEKSELIPIAETDDIGSQRPPTDVDPEVFPILQHRLHVDVAPDMSEAEQLDVEKNIQEAEAVLTLANSDSRQATVPTPGLGSAPATITPDLQTIQYGSGTNQTAAPIAITIPTEPAATLVTTDAVGTANTTASSVMTADAPLPTAIPLIGDPGTANGAPVSGAPVSSAPASGAPASTLAVAANISSAAAAPDDVPTAPLVSRQAPTIDPDQPVPTRIAEQAVDASDRAALVKTPIVGSDPFRTADLAALPTATTMASESTTPLKSLPAIPVTPAVTPLAGMSDRLAATILHSTQMNVPVTLDKIPQAVVTVALTARSATLQIDPPELGRIQLDYQFDVQGRTVVTLTPETDAARAALAERMSAITASLQAQTGGEIDVKLGSSQDFGAERGDAANSDMGESGQQSADTSGGATDGHQSTNDRALVELQRFAQAAANGDSTRLHILV